MKGNENDSADKLTETKFECELKFKTDKQVRERNSMEIALFIIGIFATVLFGLAAYFVSFHNNLKTPSVWLLFVSLILYSLVLCLYLQDKIWKQTVVASQSSIENSVQPPIKTNPILKQPTFREKVDEVYFSAGSVIVSQPFVKLKQSPLELFRFGQSILLGYVKENKPYVDVQVYGGISFPSVEIKQNEFTKPPNWDSNSNDNALEIINEKQEPVFQLYYKDSSHIVINGIFPSDNGSFVFVSEEGGITTSPNDKNKLKRIFKYPAWQYPGQFDDATPEKNVSQIPKPKKTKPKK